MKRITLILALGLFFQLALGTAYATQNPITFKCKSDGGINIAKVSINLDTKEMKWGKSPYGVLKVSEEYITALGLEREQTGGDIFVIDRASGEYWRALVGMFCEDTSCAIKRVETWTDKGLCQEIMF